MEQFNEITFTFNGTIAYKHTYSFHFDVPGLNLPRAFFTLVDLSCLKLFEFDSSEVFGQVSSS